MHFKNEKRLILKEREAEVARARADYEAMQLATELGPYYAEQSLYHATRMKELQKKVIAEKEKLEGELGDREILFQRARRDVRGLARRSPVYGKVCGEFE